MKLSTQGVEVVIEEARPACPVVEEVPEVGSAGRSVSADQRGGPTLLVEGLVPGLLHLASRLCTVLSRRESLLSSSNSQPFTNRVE
jgi:hypothetical protein